MIKTIDDFKTIINDIKCDIKNTQTRVVYQANKELIMLYFRIGKILEENGRYGNGLIKNLAMEIKLEFPNIKGFSERNLKYMKKFYFEYKYDEKVQQLVAQLPWGHNLLLMEKIKDINIRKIYIEASITNGWSKNILEFQIESKYHKRIGNSSNNFSVSLSKSNSGR